MQDENIATLDTATADVHEAVALILNAATSTFPPTSRALYGVEVALEAVLSADAPPARHVLSRAYLRAGIIEEGALEHAVDHAAMAFWSQFAACYPEIGSGDLDPMTDSTLLGAMRAAGRAWLQMNA